MRVVNELPLKLTRKCLESFGQSAVDTEVNRHAISKWIITSEIDYILSPPPQNPMTVVNELPLKLTRKCLESFGQSAVDIEVNRHAISKWVIMNKIDYILSPPPPTEPLLKKAGYTVNRLLFTIYYCDVHHDNRI